jgi:hypothetical protein
MKVQDMKDIFLLFLVLVKKNLPFTNDVFEFILSTNGH